MYLSVNTPQSLVRRTLSQTKERLNEYISNVNISILSSNVTGSRLGYGGLLLAETLDGGRIGTELYISKEMQAEPEQLGDVLSEMIL